MCWTTISTSGESCWRHVELQIECADFNHCHHGSFRNIPRMI